MMYGKIRKPVGMLCLGALLAGMVVGAPIAGSKEDADKKVDVAIEYALDKVHKGQASYYNYKSGGSACLGGFEKSYLTAAMNDTDFLNGLAGAYVEVKDEDGHKVNVLINDRYPGGKKGDIDLSRKAFKKIESLGRGRMRIKWKVIALPTDEPVQFLWKSGSSKYWAEVQVRNHRYPIKKIEYYDTATKSYKKLKRKEYNYFCAPKGMGGNGPFKFRLTDFYSHVIVEKDIPMKTNGKVVKGTKNFPYIEESKKER